MVRARAFVADGAWLHEQGLRLDAAAYAVGGAEAAARIMARKNGWSHLRALTSISLPHRFARRYVHDRQRGVPFLSSSDILLADLQGTSLISRRATLNVEGLTVPQGTTLVTRSGTVGRTAYLRAEMVGMAISEHVLRVIPRPDYEWPGFIFAFLSSQAGQAMIMQRTFGSVVQHIEAEDLEELPVPLPTPAVGSQIHELVEQAACARSEAASLLEAASECFDHQVGNAKHAYEHEVAVGLVPREGIASRLVS